MRSSWVPAALAIAVVAGLVACKPGRFSTSATFGPPSIVLDPEMPEQSYRLRLCWDGFVGEYAWAHLTVKAIGGTPARATMLVEHGDNEPMPIPPYDDPTTGAESSADWRYADVDEACDTGVVVTFALEEPIVEPEEIEWLVSGMVSSGDEEEVENLVLELHVEQLD
jgi:hypothetical protein